MCNWTKRLNKLVDDVPVDGHQEAEAEQRTTVRNNA